MFEHVSPHSYTYIFDQSEPLLNVTRMCALSACSKIALAENPKWCTVLSMQNGKYFKNESKKVTICKVSHGHTHLGYQQSLRHCPRRRWGTAERVVARCLRSAPPWWGRQRRRGAETRCRARKAHLGGTRNRWTACGPVCKRATTWYVRRTTANGELVRTIPRSFCATALPECVCVCVCADGGR